MSATPPDLAAALRTGSKHESSPRQAATELLITHDVWLGRTGFVRDCVYHFTGGQATIDYTQAAEALAEGRYRGATSALNILAFAVALATDQFGLSGLGAHGRRAVAAAVLAAVDLQPGDLNTTKDTE